MPKLRKSSTSNLLRRLIGVWLMVDGVVTGLWFTTLADSMAGRDAASVTAIIARVMVAALSVSAGWFISQQRPAGVPLGSAALCFIAIFGLLTAGTGVLPSNLDPSFRWPLAWLQVTCVAGAVLFLRRRGAGE
jgi:hypothetical protein